MSLPNLTVVQRREEAEIIPQGISLTDTSEALYLRIRIELQIITIRITKDNERISSWYKELPEWNTK